MITWPPPDRCTGERTNVLGIPEQRLIPCNDPDEALERILLGKLPRAAHLMLTDLPFARRAAKEQGAAISLSLSNSGDDAPSFDDTIAIRSDWAPLLNSINQSLDFLQRNGALRRIEEKVSREQQGVVQLFA